MKATAVAALVAALVGAFTGNALHRRLARAATVGAEDRKAVAAKEKAKPRTTERGMSDGAIAASSARAESALTKARRREARPGDEERAAMVKERIEEDARNLVNHEKWRKAHPDAMSGLERQIDSLFNWNAENYKEIGEYFEEWRAALDSDMKQGEGASDIFLLTSCRIASGAMKQLCDEYGQLANILAEDPSDKDSYWFDEIRGQNKKACDDARALLMKNIADAAGITDEGLELLTEALKSIYAATDDEDLVDPTPIVNIPKEAKLTLPDYAGIEIRDMKADEVVNDGHTMSFVGGGDSFVKFANYDDGTGIAVAGNSLCISGTASFGKITIKEHDYGADWQAVRKRNSENR